MEENTAISKIREAILRNGEVFDNLAELFKVFADGTRVRILCALTQSDMCVSEISEFLHITQSAVSHQLRTLRNSTLVKSRRSGKNIVYSLSDDHVKTIIDCGMEHITE